MNRNLSRLIYLSLVCCSAMCSCSDDDRKENSFPTSDLQVNARVADMNSPGTRATLLSSGDAVSLGSATLFAWEDNASWISGTSITYDNGKATLASSYKMDKTKNYSFLSYANAPTGITPPSGKDGAITYTVTDITTATAQTDVLIGSGSVSNPTTGDVDINYSHPYASVSFILGNADNVSKVTALSLTGVYSSGETTFSQSSHTDANGVVQYVWTKLGKANATLEATGLNTVEGKEIVTFLVIPQNLSEKNAAVTVTYRKTDDDSDYSMVKSLSDGLWKAGYTTTYTLDKVGDVAIEITSTDAVPTIRCKGNSKVYVRATITGGWYDTSGNIVAPWNSNDGTFTYAPDSKWMKVGELYYYSDPLAKDVAAGPLYTGYTPVSPAPVAGATLKLDILVQAIPYDVNKTCKEAFEAL